MPIRPDTSLLDEALEMLRDADRMHRRFFTLAPGRAGPCWEPPVDIVEDAHALIVRVALPGVPADNVDVHTDGVRLSVVGVRPFLAGTAIHRLEIPYGRFERAIDLPAGRYELSRRDFVDGCLVLFLRRLA